MNFLVDLSDSIVLKNPDQWNMVGVWTRARNCQKAKIKYSVNMERGQHLKFIYKKNSNLRNKKCNYLLGAISR